MKRHGDFSANFMIFANEILRNLCLKKKKVRQQTMFKILKIWVQGVPFPHDVFCRRRVATPHRLYRGVTLNGGESIMHILKGQCVRKLNMQVPVQFSPGKKLKCLHTVYAQPYLCHWSSSHNGGKRIVTIISGNSNKKRYIFEFRLLVL